MNPRSRTLAILLGAGVLAGAAGIGVAASGDSAGGTTTPSMSRPAGGPGGFDLSALAEEALEAAMPSGGPGGGPPPKSGTPGGSSTDDTVLS